MGVRIEKSWYFFGPPVVIYTCPNCDGELKSPVDDIGKEDDCPECDQSFVVPGEAEYQAYTNSKSTKHGALSDEPGIKHPSSHDGFYKPIILNERSFDFEREVDNRISYYRKFKYFAPILNQNPKVILGVPANTCPYCEVKLVKGKCANCGKPHRSRSSVQDYKIQVNIREEWVQPIDEQRAMRDGGHKSYLEDVRLRAAIKDVLVARNGEVVTSWPSQVISSGSIDKASEYLALERERNEYARRHDWALYTSATTQQAIILRDERNLIKETLAKFIEQVYLDLNGPSNLLPTNVEPTPEAIREHRKLLKELNCKEWDKEFSSMSFADHVVDYGNELGLSKNELAEMFIQIATDIKNRFGCPLKPATAFNKVWKYYQENYAED